MTAYVKVKATGTTSWKPINAMYVKTSHTSWKQVADVWVKVSHNQWRSFFTIPTEPSSPIEILTSFDTSDRLRLQGKNYRWVPTPSTLQYKFTVTNSENISETQDIISYTNTTNPSSGSPITVPSSTTYQTITKAGGFYYAGTLNIYKFLVKATTASGQVVVKEASYEFRIPKAPTITVTPLTATTAKLKITAASFNDYIATVNYIVYRNDSVAGTVYGTATSTNGLGQISASTDPVEVTLTGLVSGRQYTVTVVPSTGYTAYDLTNDTGYRGVSASITYTQEIGYVFAFNNVLHVSTNGYIGLGSLPSTTSDTIPTSGEFLGIVQRDLQQSDTTSVWYWSDTTNYIIRWEGYDFNNSSATKVYQVTFTKDESYADVYLITRSGGSDGATTAYIKNNVTKSNYPSALTQGSAYRVNFTSNTVTAITGSEKTKTQMKQATGLTAGTTDRGYTSLTTATNQNSFTAGTIKLTGGSTTVNKVTSGATLTAAANNDWPTGTTFTKYQWYKTRSITGLPDVAQGTGSSTTTTQTVSTVGEFYYCIVTYSNSTYGISDQTVYSPSFQVVPDKPTYTLSNLANGSARISSVSATYGTRYKGSWRRDPAGGTSYGTATTISTTLNTTNTDLATGNGNVEVTLNGVALVTYSGEPFSTEIVSWETEVKNITVTTGAAEDMTVSSTSYVAPGTQAKNITTRTSGSVDDGWYTLTLPYAITINGNSYSEMHIGTNSYVTFGPNNGSNAYSGLGTTVPNNPKIMVAAGDRGSASIYYTSSSTGWTVRYEGSEGTSGSPIAIIWQLSGTSSNTKRMRLDIQQVVASGTTGAYDKDGVLKSSLGGAGTSWFIDSGSATGATQVTYSAPGSDTKNISFASVDDNFYTVGLPFATSFNGTSYTSLSIGTNSYVTFGGGSTNYSGLGAGNPAFDKIMVDAADRGSTNFHFSSSGSSWKLRYEGSQGTSGSPIAIVWQLSASSSTPKKMRLDIGQVTGTGTTGMFSSSQQISPLGGAGTSWEINSA